MPCLSENHFLNFYGGEPLLAFELIERTVSFLNAESKLLNKKANYAITTNGSLLTDEIIHFLGEHKFSVELSFDGLAQDVQRRKGSLKKIVPNIKKLLNRPGIRFEINSVFSPETVGYLSKSIRFILDLGVPNIRLSLSIAEPWDKDSLLRLENEMSKLRKIILSHYKEIGNIPLVNFRHTQGKGFFSCAAGKDRLAIAPGGGIWGCFLFADYFQGKENSPEYSKYFFGDLEDFMKNHEIIYPRVSSNYSKLKMDNFSTSKMECFLCKQLEKCAVCPINASLSGAPLGKIPDYVCEIQKIKIQETQKFREESKLIESS